MGADRIYPISHATLHTSHHLPSCNTTRGHGHHTAHGVMFYILGGGVSVVEGRGGEDNVVESVERKMWWRGDYELW